MHTSELIVLLVGHRVNLLESTNVFGVAISSFASNSLDAQTCSLPEGKWTLLSSS